jgi:hypothetical protein
MRTKSLFKSPPAKALNAGAVTYRHRTDGFVLLIPGHIIDQVDLDKRYFGAARCDTVIHIGTVELGLHHSSRSIYGPVPYSWLVDLNSDAAVTHEVVEEPSFELAEDFA